MSAGQVAGKAEQFGRRTENSEWFDKAVRFGLVVYGVVYLVLAWLGIQLALGNNEGKATTKGAVAQLAEQPFGTFMIILVAVGMFLLVLWRLFDLFFGHHEDDGADLWKHRASDLFKALLYGTICWSAVGVLMHSGGGGSGTKDFSSTVLGLPGGQIWLTLIAAQHTEPYRIAFIRSEARCFQRSAPSSSWCPRKRSKRRQSTSRNIPTATSTIMNVPNGCSASWATAPLVVAFPSWSPIASWMPSQANTR